MRYGICFGAIFLAAGQADAQFTLAVLYLSGRLGEDKRAEAVPLLRASAEQKHNGALFVLGSLYEHGTLVPRDLTNVILASAAISATHVAAGSARVIPTTIEEGEAAGDAAALAQREGQSFLTVAGDASEVAELRALLQHDGAILSYSRRAGRT